MLLSLSRCCWNFHIDFLIFTLFLSLSCCFYFIAILLLRLSRCFYTFQTIFMMVTLLLLLSRRFYIHSFSLYFIFFVLILFSHQYYDFPTIFMRIIVEMIAHSKNKELLQCHLTTLTFNIRSWHINKLTPQYKLKPFPHIW